MRLAEARKFALSLPGTTEAPHFEKSSFRVGKKIFATVPAGGKCLHVLIEPAEAKALLAEDPDAFEEIRSAKGVVHPSFIRVHLAAADPAVVQELLEDGWRRLASKADVAAYDEA